MFGKKTVLYMNIRQKPLVEDHKEIFDNQRKRQTKIRQIQCICFPTCLSLGALKVCEVKYRTSRPCGSEYSLPVDMWFKKKKKSMYPTLLRQFGPSCRSQRAARGNRTLCII